MGNSVPSISLNKRDCLPVDLLGKQKPVAPPPETLIDFSLVGISLRLFSGPIIHKENRKAFAPDTLRAKEKSLEF